MTRDSSERRDRMAALLEEAFESGALVFSEPLLDALDSAASEEFSGHVRSEHGIEFEIERKLGRGGMATVFLARDQKHDRQIAIKVLHAELTARVGAERFVREIRLTARLQHPHVLGLLDSGVFDGDAGALAGRPYYVMPYVEGESLRTRLARERALPISDAIRVLRDVADALCYAHEEGVMHRDIKPENILLRRGRALVADFGIAKAIAAADRGSDRPEGESPKEQLEAESMSHSSISSIAFTQSSTLLGTPAYMAPEQAAAKAHVDHRADLYAWGVVAYEILTGQHPFRGRPSAAEPSSARVVEVPLPIRDVAPGLPVALGALVMRCMAKAPADRPSSAAEVVDALDEAAIDMTADSGRAAHSMRTSGTPRPAVATRKRAWRRFLLAGLVEFVLDLGLFSFVVIVLLAVAAVLLARKRASPSTAPKTVAVLPCRNLGSSQDDEYFSDGMTEELLTGLAKITPLEVAARTSSFTFKNKNLSAREIGQQLHVSALVECTVSRSGDSVRITARLINAADGHKVWSSEYDRNVRDVLAVRDEIARAVATALQVKLTADSDRLTLHHPTSEEAHELYLRGRYFFALRADEATLRKSAAAFDSATRVDSLYAAAYSGLSDAYSVLSIWGFEPPLRGFPVAKRAAQRALMLDSSLAEAHTSLGIISMWFDNDENTARRELTHAIALDPRYPAAHLFYAWYLANHRSPGAAVAEARIARELDPLSIIVNIRVGTMLFYAERYEEALRELHSSLELDSTNAMTHAELASAFVHLRRCSEAFGEIRQLPASFQNSERGVEGFAYAVCGRRPEAEAMLKDLVKQWQHGFMFASRIAALEVGLGKNDEALAWLDSAITQRDPRSHSIAIEPLFRPLRSDPRFHRLLAKAGLE